MLEMLINPKKAERRPWEMFFIGAFYASISVLLVTWVFSQDAVLVKSSGILVVLFTVLFSLPFIYYTLRLEESRITRNRGSVQLLKDHRHAIYAFLWLFVGFVVAFAFWYAVLPTTDSFKTQIETYCMINRPANFNECVTQYGIKDAAAILPFLTNKERLFLIFTNNMYVLLFTLVFSLIFGAGVIFILAWNATVIGAAIGIVTDYKIISIWYGFLKFMSHGIFEIASYFIIALAGGMVSVAVINHETGTDKFWGVLQDSLNLIIVAIIILFAAALMEVFLTPVLF
jgi:uncharacterized membrane protein SpoIIM required for sporulation